MYEGGASAPPILSTTPAPTTLFSGHVGAGEVGKGGGGACAAHVPVQRTRKLVQRFSGYDAFRIMINSAEGFDINLRFDQSFLS